MPEKPAKPQPSEKDRDGRVAIPLDPEEALKALLKVVPEAEESRPEGAVRRGAN